jgi:hypothetical protein
MNKLNPNKLNNDNITKLENTDDKMILLNLINQENHKYMHYKIVKDQFKSVLKDLNKPQEIIKSIESEVIEESLEIQESGSNFEIKNEIKNEIENHLEFDTIYEKNEPEEIIYYDPNQVKLKTVAKIMYSKHNLDQLIKKKKW